MSLLQLLGELESVLRSLQKDDDSLVLSIDEALCLIYQPFVRDVVILPHTPIVPYLQQLYVVKPPKSFLFPLRDFLTGGCTMTSSTTDIEYHASESQFVCVRTPSDPLQALIEDCVPAGEKRLALSAAIQSRVRLASQKQKLENLTYVYRAREKQTRRNLGYILQSTVEDASSLQTALVGLLEATGAVSARHFTQQEVYETGQVIAKSCQTAPDVETCIAGIKETLKPRQLEKLKLIGLNL